MADDIRIGISVVADGAGAAKAQKDLVDIKKRIAELKNEFKLGAKDVNTFEKELKDLEGQARKLDKALDAVGEKRRIDIDSGELVDVTRRTGAEGLRTLGRDIRGLPSVQVPGLGIGTDTFGRAAEVAGRLGVSLEQLAVAGGATVIAVGLIAVAFKEFADAAKRQAAELTAVVEARRDVGQDVAQGLTTEDAQKRLEEINRLREREQELLGETSQALKDAQRETSVANLLGGDFETTEGSRFLSGLIPQVSALQEQVDKSTASVASLTAEETALNAALEDGSLAANDAAKAEADLAAQRTQSVLTEAAQAGELASLKERVTTLTQEQIDSELEALERRKVGVEAELASLEASGDTSEEVAKKIAQLKEQLGFLGEQADALNQARPSAKSSEAEKAAEKAAKDRERETERTAKESQKRLEDAAKAQQQYSDKVADAGKAFRDSVADINQTLKDNLIDNARELQDDIAEDTIKFNQDEQKEERAHQQELANIKRDAAREELDATRARDFAAAAAARERAQNAVDDENRQEKLENAEQLLEFQQHHEELGRERDRADREDREAAKRATRDARTDQQRAIRDAATDRQRALRDQRGMEQTFQRDSLNGWNNYFKQVSNMQRAALGGGSRGTGGGRATGSGGRASGQQVTMDDFYSVVSPR